MKKCKNAKVRLPSKAEKITKGHQEVFLADVYLHYLNCFIYVCVYVYIYIYVSLTDIYVCISKNITIHTESKSISHSVMSSSL